MATGTVEWLNPDKGSGFVQPGGGGKDVFVRVAAVRAAGLRNLAESRRAA